MKDTIIKTVEAGALDFVRGMPRHRATLKEAQDELTRVDRILASKEQTLREYAEFLEEHAPVRGESWAQRLGVLD